MLEQCQKYLKENRTASERMFAHYLRKQGIEFVEQEIICGYIPDFYFPNHGNRIVELDGKFHKGREEYDRLRDLKLRNNGFEVLRVPSSAVFWRKPWLLQVVSEFLGTPFKVPTKKLKKRQEKAIQKPKKKRAKWAKVPRLTKDHLPVRQQKRNG